MGYLTPILIRNDNVHQFRNKKKQKQLCNEIYTAAAYASESRIDHCHECLGAAHANENRVIVIHGNTWIDLSHNAWGDFKRKDDVYIDYLKSCLKIAQRDITQLRKRLKELEK